MSKLIRTYVGLVSLLMFMLFSFACELPGVGGGTNDTTTTTTIIPDTDITVTPIIATPTGDIWVSPSGSDTTGDGSVGNPYKTLAFAANLAVYGNVIKLTAGTFAQSQAVMVPLGVSIEGQGTANTILSASAVAPPAEFVGNSNLYKYHEGSLIQLTSPVYPNDAKYSENLSDLIKPENGNQSLSGFTITSPSNQLKAGVWVENRNNVVMHDVNFNNIQTTGAVFTRGDMIFWAALPEGQWMRNILIYNCTFTNSAQDRAGFSTGNLQISGLNGAEIYNITINENEGYGIKFYETGHFRNLKIYDCTIAVPNSDPIPDVAEDISIELWNFSYGNEIYNITCNTWLSLVNWEQMFNAYKPTDLRPSNLKVHNITMVGTNPANNKESIECAVPGTEIYDSYFEEKGFGIAVWNGGGYKVSIHNNIFYSNHVTDNTLFARGAGVFIDNSNNTRNYTDIQVYNNTFDGYDKVAVYVKNFVHDVTIKNNVFLNTAKVLDTADTMPSVIGRTYIFQSNLSTVTPVMTGSGITSTGNFVNDPEFSATGDRDDTYYQPSSASSFVVDKGVDVDLPFEGLAPDLGRWDIF